jgi:hypothetical protein
VDAIAILIIADVAAAGNRNAAPRLPFGIRIRTPVCQFKGEGPLFHLIFSYSGNTSVPDVIFIRRLGASPKPRLTPVFAFFNPSPFLLILAAMQRPILGANGAGKLPPRLGAGHGIHPFWMLTSIRS